MEWDNVGLLVGDMEQEVHRIFVALDVTDETLEQAIACDADMIITHHPMLFSPMKRIVADDFIGKRLLKMISHHICYYAMHTNFDVTGMADLNAQDLKLKDPKVLDVTYEEEEIMEGIGRVGTLPLDMSLERCAVYVKSCLELDHVMVYGEPTQMIHTVAISSGSGKSMKKAALKAGADVLITGDIDYHTGIDAVDQGLAIIDAGHYGTEKIFIPYMEQELSDMFPSIRVTAAVLKHPFVMC